MNSRPRTPATLPVLVPRRVAAEREEGCRSVTGTGKVSTIRPQKHDTCASAPSASFAPRGRNPPLFPFHNLRLTARRLQPQGPSIASIVIDGRTAPRPLVSRCIADRTYCMRSPALHGSSNIRQSSRRLWPFLHNTGSQTFSLFGSSFHATGATGGNVTIDAPGLWSKLPCSECGRDESEAPPS